MGKVPLTSGECFFSFVLLYRVRNDVHNTSPSCGVSEFEQTWASFYDAANLRDTYRFLGSGTRQPHSSLVSGYSGRSGPASDALQEVQPPGNLTANWSPVLSSASAREDRDYSGASEVHTTSALAGLTVATVPVVMELRVCEMVMGLRGALGCLMDPGLADSRTLDQCITNIEEVSIDRLGATQHIIDLELQLASLEAQEY